MLTGNTSHSKLRTSEETADWGMEVYVGREEAGRDSPREKRGKNIQAGPPISFQRRLKGFNLLSLPIHGGVDKGME